MEIYFHLFTILIARGWPGLTINFSFLVPTGALSMLGRELACVSLSPKQLKQGPVSLPLAGYYRSQEKNLLRTIPI